jgi:hypothetical protein
VSSPRRSALFSLSLLLLALLAAGDWLLVTSRGSQAPRWAHWWCSASGSSLSARHGSEPSPSLLARLFDSLAALLPHWPHILPIVAALATLLYLWRANARYDSSRGQPQISS